MEDLRLRFFKNNKLVQIPKKEKDKILLFDWFVTLFNHTKTYSEKEINEIIKAYYDDYAIIRRYMVDYGYLKRTDDGKCYERVK
ncbi:MULTISPECIES: DUF2087 domain-containing protein [Macrococcus]|uniref:DUF2087 domain-containing protein n=1 Tax=Macrococcus psychrotolerans TaxID=3039389 RepID=A0AAU6RIC0_9STAP|nr:MULTISPECIES: DUF2087 domain-containing protein [Macrococcus]MDJ1110991.1 DUF2087 domain-containing protein [Macrococcus sp. S115]QYA33472.1 DUF2087 domain-containing protein [Macrococcus sp. 19Msa1099]QYA38291.1 DUF2087 domain-containing protein [Macrococcus caseolyticus]QYA76998.1 DUF2087 domain-containing protein [Macrococcus caseolyticus]